MVACCFFLLDGDAAGGAVFGLVGDFESFESVLAVDGVEVLAAGEAGVEGTAGGADILEAGGACYGCVLDGCALGFGDGAVDCGAGDGWAVCELFY